MDYIKDLTIYDIIGGTDKQNVLPADYLKNRLNKPESISYFIDKKTKKKSWTATWNINFIFWYVTVVVDGETGKLSATYIFQDIPSKYR